MSSLVTVPATNAASETNDGCIINGSSLYEEHERLVRSIQNLNLKTMICKTETHHLQREESAAKQEVKRIQAVPLLLGTFVEAVDAGRGIVGGSSSSNYYVRILSTLDKEKLKPGTSVGLHKGSNSCVQILPNEVDTDIHVLRKEDRPDVTYSDVGGLDMQKQEIREAVELPLTHASLYDQIGIDPPRGVLLYGPPGTGKTMLVKAVAHHTNAAFISVVGSEFVQKYLGEGPRKVRDVFRLARENAPAIIFIDEVDSIATKRFDAQTGADREVQRVLIELLTQMDGFDQTTNVKVIMATNRWDTLDPAILRPGRLDRKIEFPYPDRRQKRLVFQVCTARMNLSPEVDLEEFVTRPERLTGADIQSICHEAGMLAVRKNRYVVLPKDIESAYRTVTRKTGEEQYDFYS
nr:putative proteasome regulatory ATPase subunit 3 [Trypanosoma congolense IL3000]